MNGNLRRNRILWFLTAILSLTAGLSGVIKRNIYNDIVSREIMPGVFSQDLMTILASVIVLLLLIRIKKDDLIKHAVILGITGYFFYAYGIYVIERFYNALYFVYLAVFALSFYSIVYGIAGVNSEVMEKILLPKSLRIISIIFLLLNPLMFYPLWISQIVPLIRASRKIEFLYSVYVLDLCFIMPAFIILAVMTAKKRKLGFFLTPALFILGFTLLFPLAVGEFLKPLLYQLPIDTGSMVMFLCLSVMFLIIAITYLRSLKLPNYTRR